MPCTIELWPEQLLPPLFPDLVATLGLGLGMGLLLVLSQLGRKYLGLKTETTRKSVHLIVGVSVSFLPCMFSSFVSVFLVGSFFFVVMVLSKKMGWLAVIHDVERNSKGAALYPVSLLLILVLSGGDALLFQIPVLVLAFSDAMAAIVGVNYGRVHFHIYDQKRSLEGSTVFFVVSFLVIHLPLVLSGRVEPLFSVIIALILGAIVTGLEAISLRGWDNAIIPYATLFGLQHMLVRPMNDFFDDLITLLVLIILSLLTGRRQRLSAASMIAAVLLGYGSSALGGWHWLAPLLFFYLVFHLDVPVSVVQERNKAMHILDQAEEMYDLRRTFYMFVPMLVLLLLNDFYAFEFLYPAFLAATGALLCISWLIFYDLRKRGAKKGQQLGTQVVVTGGSIVLCVMGPISICLVAMCFPQVPSYSVWSYWLGVIAGALGGVVLFLVANHFWQGHYQCPHCRRVNDAKWCHGQPGTLYSGKSWLDFDRCSLAATLGAIAITGVSSLF